MKPLIITKSLFKEFTQSPKLARWHINDKTVYNAIQDDQYGGMDGLEVGQEVERVVLQRFAGQTIHNVTISWFADYHQQYHNKTVQAFVSKPDILYQAGALINWLFIKTDILQKNASGTYDIIEVKSKNNIRKKTDKAPILEDILYDVSFQHYVMKHAFPELYSGHAYVAYLQKEYVKQWAIDPIACTTIEDITDAIIPDDQLELIIGSMRNSLHLPRAEFESLYPYNADDHLLYFGTPAPKKSIFTIPRLKGSKQKFMDLFARNKISIADLDAQDIAGLAWADGEDSSFQRFVHLYQTGQEYIDHPAIQARLSALHFPLCFYDYETVATPIPLLDGTSPRQQVVVQYSLHIMQTDGSTKHYSDIIQAGATDNHAVVASLAQRAPKDWTYIVRNRSFECDRNKEIILRYPEFAEMFTYINEHTFDLMEIFKEREYFHPDFQWSYSIKKVLPVVTDISYDNLAVWDGGVATELLQKLIKNTLDNTPQTVANLLEYCKLDTRAMIEIYKKIVAKISNS